MSLRSIAREHHVSHTTIHRAGLFTRAVNTVADAVGEAPIEILRGDVQLGKQEWQLLAEIAKAQPQAAKNVIAAIRAGKKRVGEGKMKEANQIVRQAYDEIVMRFAFTDES